MKIPIKSILLLTALCLLTTSLSAQWKLQNSGTNNNLYSVFCVSADTVYTVGENGTILKTTDGGTNWSTQISNTTYDLNSVFCINADTVFAVGDNGAILKTNNGGISWDILSSGTIYDLSSVFFTGKDTGYVVGEWGTILKTHNGGAIWDTLNSGTYYNLNSIYFTSNYTGYIVGDGSVFLKTIDAAAHWNIRILNTPLPLNLQSVYFTDMNTGYIVERLGNILKTVDGGDSCFFVYGDGLGSKTPLISIHFPNHNTGYAVGWDGLNCSNVILKTTNEGVDWDTNWYSNNGFYNSIFFVNKDTGFVVGETIRKTTNGGIDTVNVSINNNYKNGGIIIYPNPAKDKINVIYESNREISLMVEILDVMGSSLFRKKLSNINIQIEISNYPKGIYYVVVSNCTSYYRIEKLIVY